jgi:ABC-type sugar transport system substrate-binding protein
MGQQDRKAQMDETALSASADLGGLGGPRALGRRSELSRRRFLHGAVGVLALTAGGVLSACGEHSKGAATGDSAPTKHVTFGYSAPYGEVPIVVVLKNTIKHIAEGDGWKVQLDQTQGGKLQDQLATLDTWITQKITAMNVALLDPSAYEATARRAEQAGVIWTTYGGTTKAGAGGVDFPPDLSGQVTGKFAVEWIKANDPKAEVLILEIPAGGPYRARTDIPRKMIAQQTDAKVVAVQGAIDQTTGLQVTEDVLQAHSNLSVVIGHNDDGALGAAEAFRKAGKDPSKVCIVGQDGSKDALTALRAGNTYYKASAALDIHKVCQSVVDLADRAIKRNWKPGDPQDHVALPPTLVKVGDTTLIDRFIAAYDA